MAAERVSPLVSVCLLYAQTREVPIEFILGLAASFASEKDGSSIPAAGKRAIRCSDLKELTAKQSGSEEEVDHDAAAASKKTRV